MRRYLVGQVASVIGAWSQIVALNLLVYELTASAWLLGLLNFLIYGPMLFVAPFAGGRLSSGGVKRVLLAVLVANASLSGVLWWCVMAGTNNIWLLLVIATCSGALSAAELPARLVLITGMLQDARHTTNAISLNVLANNVARMLGAPVGAALFAFCGAAIVFALCVATTLAMAACVATIPVLARDGVRQRGAGLREGLRYVRHEPFASFYLPVIGLMGMFAASYPTLVPLLSGSVFGNASRFTGLFLSCAGGGAVVASLTLSSRIGSFVAPRLIGVSHWIACASLASVAIAPSVAAASAAFLLLGACVTFTNSASSALMLQQCPDPMRGPIAGLYSMAFAGVLPFGHLLIGALSSQMGARATALAMALSLAAVLLMLRWIHSQWHPGASPAARR